MTARRRIVAVLARWGKRRLFWGGVLGLYGLLGVFVVIPMGRQTLRDHREVKELEQQLADLDAWTVAGMWLAPEVARRQPVMTAAWERAFPAERRREELFLDIARVADDCRLQGFQLREITPSETPMPPPLQATLDGRNPDGGIVGGIPVVPPRIQLGTYRVKAAFKSDYAGAARFIYGVRKLDRAMGIHDLVLRRDKGQVKVDLEMDIYVGQIS